MPSATRRPYDPAQDASTVEVKFPGRPKFTGLWSFPSRDVELPVHVRAKFRAMAWPLIVTAPLGLSAALLAVGLILEKGFALMGSSQLLLVLILCSAMGVLGITISLSLLTLLADRLAPTPLLEIDRDHLLDRRAMREPLTWSDIMRAEIKYTGAGPVAVHLSLRRVVDARHNRFCLGTLGQCWQRAVNELHVPVMFLDMDSYELANLILTLVARHGGEVASGYTVIGADPFAALDG